MRLIIAVDGPAAAGKGTLAKSLAVALGLPHLDTGLLYRAVARQMILAGLDPAQDDGEQTALALQPEDLLRDDLRVPEIDRGASAVATQPPVRSALLKRQREFATASGAVIDGRDIGTVVFPDANLKFFVTASAAVRALRRYQQLYGLNACDEAALAALTAEIKERDRKDAERPVSPLRQADDAVLIETDDLDADAVLAHALSVVKARCSA